MKTNYSICLLFFLMASFLNACIHSDAFEKNYTISSNNWKASFKPVFIFDITDTNANYSLFLTMRHTDAYPYSNIWLNMTTISPGEKTGTKVKVEIPLAQADGKWLGRGMNEIWEHKMLLSRNGEVIHFSKKGAYQINLEQIMRVDPLPQVMSIGIRLEKNP